MLTDHYSPLTFLPAHYLRPQKAIEDYLSSYHKLKEWCGNSFTVLLGLELRHYGVVNDYLIYGVEEDWLKQQKNMLLWNEKKMCKEMHRQCYLIYQAHPYRPLIYRCMNANATVNICVRVIVRFILFCERNSSLLYFCNFSISSLKSMTE